MWNDKFTACQPPCSWMDVKLGWPDKSNYTGFPVREVTKGIK